LTWPDGRLYKGQWVTGTYVRSSLLTVVYTTCCKWHWGSSYRINGISVSGWRLKRLMNTDLAICFIYEACLIIGSLGDLGCLIIGSMDVLWS